MTQGLRSTWWIAFGRRRRTAHQGTRQASGIPLRELYFFLGGARITSRSPMGPAGGRTERATTDWSEPGYTTPRRDALGRESRSGAPSRARWMTAAGRPIPSWDARGPSGRARGRRVRRCRRRRRAPRRHRRDPAPRREGVRKHPPGLGAPVAVCGRTAPLTLDELVKNGCPSPWTPGSRPPPRCRGFPPYEDRPGALLAVRAMTTKHA